MDGAEEFVYQKLDDCVNTSDCRDLGETAASIAAVRFCVNKSPKSGPNFFPTTCVSVAKNRCKDEVIDEVIDEVEASRCGSTVDAMAHVNELEVLCDVSVDGLAETAMLPRRRLKGTATRPHRFALPRATSVKKI